MTYREQLQALQAAQRQEYLALREQHQVEMKALFQRQLEKRLEFVRSNPEGVLETALIDMKEEAQNSYRYRTGE